MKKQSAKQKEHWDTVKHRLYGIHVQVEQTNTGVEKIYQSVVDAKISYGKYIKGEL